MFILQTTTPTQFRWYYVRYYFTEVLSAAWARRIIYLGRQLKVLSLKYSYVEAIWINKINFDTTNKLQS